MLGSGVTFFKSYRAKEKEQGRWNPLADLQVDSSNLKII